MARVNLTKGWQASVDCRTSWPFGLSRLYKILVRVSSLPVCAIRPIQRMRSNFWCVWVSRKEKISDSMNSIFWVGVFEELKVCLAFSSISGDMSTTVTVRKFCDFKMDCVTCPGPTAQSSNAPVHPSVNLVACSIRC